MSVIARWCFRHRLLVIATWVAVLIGLGALAQAVKGEYNNSSRWPAPFHHRAATAGQDRAGPGRRLRHDRLAGQPRRRR